MRVYLVFSLWSEWTSNGQTAFNRKATIVAEIYWHEMIEIIRVYIWSKPLFVFACAFCVNDKWEHPMRLLSAFWHTDISEYRPNGSVAIIITVSFTFLCSSLCRNKGNLLFIWFWEGPKALESVAKMCRALLKHVRLILLQFK